MGIEDRDWYREDCKRRRNLYSGNNNRKKPGNKTGLIAAVIMTISLLAAARYALADNGGENVISSYLAIPGMTKAVGMNVEYSDDGTAGLPAGKYYFYDQLEMKDKKAYELFLDLAEHRDDKNYRSEIVIPAGYSKDISARLQYDCRLMYYDHPEYFWMGYAADDDRIAGKYIQSAGKTYMQYSLRSPADGEDAMIGKFNAAADRFMADIDLNQPDDQIELFIVK